MLKKILTISIVVLCVVYLAYSIIMISHRDEDRVCSGIVLNISDSIGTNLIDEDMVLALFKEYSLNPVDSPCSKIDIQNIEEKLSKHPLIGKVQCYVTGGGSIRLDIWSKVPLVRVMNNRGQDYYVDSRGEILRQHSLVVQLPVATGYIDDRFARNELLNVVRAIDKSDFWKAQVEQIDVAKDGEIRLVPRVGDHILILGDANNIESKLDRIMSFYHNGLDNIGWNKYYSISVAYENQVVCKKRK